MASSELAHTLARIAAALERAFPPPLERIALEAADAFVFEPGSGGLRPVSRVSRLPLHLLYGISRQAEILLANTRRFAKGLPANNALLWGARGMGKSSLVKAVHGQVLAEQPGALVLIEIHRDDLGHLGPLLHALARTDRRCLLFCDDLSFDSRGTDYRSLKALLEGGLEGRPENVLIYATSNRRHLLPREAIEQEQRTALHPGEVVEEKISLSDRFGLSLGFHPCSQEDYLAMVERYADHFGLDLDRERLRDQALAWARERGGRSGRIAWQFIQDLAGRLGVRIALG